jgi:hypothetical protein
LYAFFVAFVIYCMLAKAGLRPPVVAHFESRVRAP